MPLLAAHDEPPSPAPAGRLRVHCFSISLDGYGAGPRQTRETPLGAGGESLHEWLLPTRTFKHMVGETGGTTGIDDDFAARGVQNIGAWILGRNMFGPVRGEWPDDNWKGWWGDDPPYHVPVFVLTHHARPSITMQGGTTFHFVTDGIHCALRRAREAARGRDVRVGGGVATIQQYLRERLIDEMHFALAPILLGSGESLFGAIDAVKLGYRCAERYHASGHARRVAQGNLNTIVRNNQIFRDMRLWHAACLNDRTTNGHEETRNETELKREVELTGTAGNWPAALAVLPPHSCSFASIRGYKHLRRPRAENRLVPQPRHFPMSKTIPKNTICFWFNKDALDAARFYAATFPDSKVIAVHHAPSDYPSGKAGDVLTVEFTVCGIPCLGLNGGPTFSHSEAFSFQIATDTQEETDRYWNAIIGNGGQESACGWCKDRWGLSWQITPRALTDAMTAGGAEAKRAFEAMMEMGKIDIAKIEAARRG